MLADDLLSYVEWGVQEAMQWAWETHEGARGMTVSERDCCSLWAEESIADLIWQIMSWEDLAHGRSMCRFQVVQEETGEIIMELIW